MTTLSRRGAWARVSHGAGPEWHPGGARAAGAVGGRDRVINEFSPAIHGTLSSGNSFGIMGLSKAYCSCPQWWGRASKKKTVKFLSSNRIEDDATREKRARTP